MTSTRLPGKVLLPLCGKTVLEIMLDRLISFRAQIIIATTNDGSEAPIVELCQKLGIRSYRGDRDNVLERYYQCAVSFGAKAGDTIVRLTSDCPLIDQEVVSDLIDFYRDHHYDYVSNTTQRSFPRGFDCEVFSFSALETAYQNGKDPFETEHVTTYIHTTHKEDFSIGAYAVEKNASKYRLTLDETDDYTAIQEVYKKFDCRTDFDYETLLEMLEANDYIYKINEHIEQKKA